MSISVLEFDADLVFAYDSDADETSEDDIFGGPCRLLSMFVNNGSALTYVKFLDSLAPTEGTTEPDIVVPIAANDDPFVPFNIRADGSLPGILFATGLSMFAASDAGKGATAPSGGTITVGLLAMRV